MRLKLLPRGPFIFFFLAMTISIRGPLGRGVSPFLFLSLKCVLTYIHWTSLLSSILLLTNQLSVWQHADQSDVSEHLLIVVTLRGHLSIVVTVCRLMLLFRYQSSNKVRFYSHNKRLNRLKTMTSPVARDGVINFPRQAVIRFAFVGRLCVDLSQLGLIR